MSLLVSLFVGVVSDQICHCRKYIVLSDMAYHLGAVFVIPFLSVFWRSFELICLSAPLFICMSGLPVFLFVSVSVCVSVCVFVSVCMTCMSVCLSMCVSMCPSLCLSVCVSVCVCLSVCLSFCLSVCVCLPVCLSVHLSVCF